MTFAEWLFWIPAFAIAYHIGIYGLLLYIINLFKAAPNTPDTTDFPKIIVLCPAFNEESSIAAKIESFLALDYPTDRIKMLVISDDSTDATNDIVMRYAHTNVELLVQRPRQGKQSAHNLAQQSLDCDYVLSTDANSIFAPDAVKHLISAIKSEAGIGLVSGELRLLSSGKDSSGEGLYWKYESFLKQMDSRFHSIVGANGSLYLIKRELFTAIHKDSVDDFERTLYVLGCGFKAKYEPKALVFEPETEKASQEISRKIRIISREWFVMQRQAKLLNPFRYPKECFMLLSHKLLRWVFFLLAAAILGSSVALVQHTFYRRILLLQMLFYAYGSMGLLAQKHQKRLPASGMPAYITAMIYSSMMAFKNFVLRRQFGTWKPVR